MKNTNDLPKQQRNNPLLYLGIGFALFIICLILPALLVETLASDTTFYIFCILGLPTSLYLGIRFSRYSPTTKKSKTPKVFLILSIIIGFIVGCAFAPVIVFLLHFKKV